MGSAEQRAASSLLDPQMSRPRVSLSQSRLKRVARTPVEAVVILSLPIDIGGALVAGPLIRLLHGTARDDLRRSGLMDAGARPG